MNVAILTSYANSDRYIGAVRVNAIRHALDIHEHRYSVYTSDTSVHDERSQVFQDSVGHIAQRFGILSYPLKVIRKLWYAAFGIASHPLYKSIIDRVIIDHRHEEFDVIFATSPQAEMLEAAAYLSSKTQVPLVSDLRDGLIFEPLKKLNFVELSVYQRIETSLAERSSAITTVSDALCEYFVENYGVDKSIVHTLTNGFNLLDTVIDGVQPKKPVTLSDTAVNIIFTGRVALSTKDLLVSIGTLEQALELLPASKRDKLQFHFVGEFTFWERRRMKRNFILHDKLPRSDILGVQRDADYLLLLGGTRRATIPGKMYEYLVAKRPVLAIGGSNSSLEKMVSDTDCGIFIENGDISTLAEVLVQLNKGTACNTQNISRYDWDSLGQRLNKILNDVLNAN